LGKWGSKEYYVNKGVDEPTLALSGCKILHALIFRNDPCLHSGALELTKYHGKSADLLVEIGEHEVDGDDVVSVIAGITPDPISAEREWGLRCRDKTSSLVQCEVLPNTNGPSIFIAVLKCDAAVERGVLERDLALILDMSRVSVHGADQYSVVEGREQIGTLRGSGFGDAPEPASPEPPYLPVKVESWMRVFNVEIGFQADAGDIRKVGPLVIKSLPSFSAHVQLFEVEALSYLIGEDPVSCSISWSKNFFYFQYSQYRGVDAIQVVLAGQRFQISINGVMVENRSITGEPMKLGEGEGVWFMTYWIEVVEMGSV
jgi:hypothetical protein